MDGRSRTLGMGTGGMWSLGRGPSKEEEANPRRVLPRWAELRSRLGNFWM